ncbi:glycosyltransferase involved in cell wall biosynthesis [Altererythrobacter atlanticus]|uniref:N, N'-diacetylbacillosaminyl-diphospho-undecaprenol alpha-1,3-N-acetylgalactosaminyltransferase n=1 Tax=Croceibacterium atlanticum TaxID=1267766 RepID=A0A0F7KVP9_9SPHN|nr:glycosyltransferase family 4 protein [Croceibacterium atlanticum]AKH42855.1 N,N'-diacetylbacillosaminyl-diphospho-undecaprenol alpha-1,3-N-acetylgalactosaminyltransferase [Croceibacterium atlanticum]MBB5731635.1 glycosyltransferase involved in cell wall biosynthesis [Croceibacterium atlanticum]
MKILVHSSLAYSLVNFRGALLAALVAEGHDVIATAPDRDDDIEAKLAAMDVKFEQIPMARASLSPFKDLQTLWAYVRMMRRHKPDVVISYTQKPIIYGGLATRLAGKARYYVIMSGLGFIFSEASDARTGLRKLVSRMYREAIRKARTVFVFNSDDRSEMLRHGIVSGEQRVVQVPGSGVDTRRFLARPIRQDPPVVLMIARLMRDKGVKEFVEAAKIVKQRIPAARFQILGRLEEDNPTGISKDELAQWCSEGVIELLPETRDVRPYLEEATIFSLPSYYREGLPRTILEALSSGRPVVTTDLPGCRDAINHRQNGLLVPPRDPQALADAVLEMLADPARLEAMSVAARDLAERKYDVRRVNEALIDVMCLKASAPAETSAATQTITPAAEGLKVSANA